MSAGRVFFRPTPDDLCLLVPLLGIVIGNIRQKAEFTLSNRSHLDYQVLVGRNILSDVMLVDVSQANIAPPEVPERVGQ